MSSASHPAVPSNWSSVQPHKWFSAFAWLVLVYNIPVILWGAFVRASYSGDGCGANWPFCQGQVIPANMKLPTVIEFTHRMTISVDSVLVIALCVWAFAAFPKRHAVRLYATLSLIFLLIEALLGAGLVLFRYVANDQSAGRVWYLSLHLVNTFTMLAVMTATAWFATAGIARFSLRRISAPVWSALGVTALVGVTGVFAALGDTLFPAPSLAAGLHQDVSSAVALLKLRPLHPVLAICGAAFLLFVCGRISRSGVGGTQRQAAIAVVAITLIQLAAGMVNLSLLVPVWMQLVHLLIADALWIAVVMVALTTEQRTSVR